MHSTYWHTYLSRHQVDLSGKDSAMIVYCSNIGRAYTVFIVRLRIIGFANGPKLCQLVW